MLNILDSFARKTGSKEKSASNSVTVERIRMIRKPRNKKKYAGIEMSTQGKEEGARVKSSWEANRGSRLMVGLSGLEDWSVCTRREKKSRPACGCLYIPVASWFYLKIHICNARNQTPAHNHVRKGSTTELYSFLTLSQLPLTTLQSTSQRYSCFSNHGPAGVERGYQCCINIKKSRDAKKVIP